MSSAAAITATARKAVKPVIIAFICFMTATSNVRACTDHTETPIQDLPTFKYTTFVCHQCVIPFAICANFMPIYEKSVSIRGFGRRCDT